MNAISVSPAEPKTIVKEGLGRGSADRHPGHSEAAADLAPRGRCPQSRRPILPPGHAGVMSFIVSHDGTVYEKDLGPNTGAIARAMTRFNPDSSWRKVTVPGG